MSGRQIALYFAWSRPDEVAAPLGVLEDRFPALFELRRLSWPRLENFADPSAFDQGIDGFLDHIQLANFQTFADLTGNWTGNPVRRAERKTAAGVCELNSAILADVDTLIIISFDSARTNQRPSAKEIKAVQEFLSNPDHLLFVCPHHDIGDAGGLAEHERLAREELEFHHHGDPAIPARQRFGDFGIALLQGLGLSVQNRFGLRPAKMPDGSPAPIEVTDRDRLQLLAGVTTFNLHFHLPHLDRTGDAKTKLDVLARQPVDTTAPPHPFTLGGRQTFDALLQSGPGIFPGAVLVCDTTIWSSTVGGLDSLQKFWRNVVVRPRQSDVESGL